MANTPSQTPAKPAATQTANPTPQAQPVVPVEASEKLLLTILTMGVRAALPLSATPSSVVREAKALLVEIQKEMKK